VPLGDSIGGPALQVLRAAGDGVSAGRGIRDGLAASGTRSFPPVLFSREIHNNAQKIHSGHLCLQLALYPVVRKCYVPLWYLDGSLFVEAAKPFARRRSQCFALHLSPWFYRRCFCCQSDRLAFGLGRRGIPYDPLVASPGALHGFVQPAIAAPHSAVRGRHGVQLQQDRSLPVRGAARCGQASGEPGGSSNLRAQRSPQALLRDSPVFASQLGPAKV